MAEMVSIGKKLKLYRVAQLLTQKGLAEKIGAQQPVISAIELGRACPIEQAEKIAEVLGYTIDDLRDDAISRPGVIEKTVESLMDGGITTKATSENIQVDLPPVYGKVGVECQRTVGDMGSERWDRVRVYMEMPCIPEERDKLKEELIENTIRSVDETMQKIARRALQEPIQNLKIS